MRYFLTIFVFLFSLTEVFAQSERLYNLPNNPQLRIEAEKANQQAAKRSSDFAHRHARKIQLPDTLSLPFKDDFTKERMPKLTYWDNFGVEGYWTSTCRADSLFSDTVRYMNDTAWRYTFDNASNTVDSFPKEQIALAFFDDTLDCATLDQVNFVWPSYYRITFDTSTGARIDSQLVTPDDTLFSEPAIVGRNDPSTFYLDNDAYRNNNYPVDPPTVGVVTLNGLNKFGLPHNRLMNNGRNFGPADTLTSKPISLQGLNQGDDVKFSFFWQPKGLADYPNEKDSLLLEFKDAFGEWNTVWKRGGYESDIQNPQFQYEVVDVDEPKFFFNDFQFRFSNYASIMGNNDHWHLDYFFLDENRPNASDSAFKDIAISNKPTELLTFYEAMPWTQFKDFQSEELKSQISFSFRNLASDTNSNNVAFRYNVVDAFRGTTLFEGVNPTTGNPFSFQLSGQQEQSLAQIPQINIDNTSNFTPFGDSIARADSALITLEAIVNINNDNLRTNDTVKRQYPFFNYFAYDDGSAEKAYGVEGPGTKKIAYEFVLNKPDTLRALRIHFTQIDQNVSNLEFDLLVWKRIDLNNDGKGEDTLAYIPNLTPRYIYSQNGFATYKLEEPLAISDTFYVGLIQESRDNIQIGFDKNNNRDSRIFFYAGQSWKRTLFEGALMMRPIVGRDVQLPTSVEDQSQQIVRQELQFRLYPNPADNQVQLQIPQTGDYTVEVYDNTGSLRKRNSIDGSEQISVHELPAGVYFVRLLNERNGQSKVKKLVKMSR